VPDDAPVLVLINADPRETHRANEGMRIGLGIVAGENEVTFVLRGAGVHLLDEDTDDLVDGDEIAKFRANLRRLDIPFHVEASDVPRDPGWNADGHPVRSIARADLVALLRAARGVLAF
jgi:hypothetical protein